LVFGREGGSCMTKRFTRKVIGRLVIVAAVGLPLGLAAEIMWSSGPADGFTGAPGENTCQQCHEFGPGDGSLELLGIPAEYIPNATYDLIVRLEDPGQQRWGFELTAVDDVGNGAGSFTITDPVHTQLSDNNPSTARDYVKHTSAGTYNGTLDGPVTWTFQWTAPAGSAGEVTFYVAGNAADGDGTTLGNYIYSASVSLTASNCGDANASGGVDIDDVVHLINYIFAEGPPPDPLEAGDADCSGGVDIDDVVHLINYIFGGGNAPCDTDGDGQPDC
jgi:hypothetical protein